MIVREPGRTRLAVLGSPIAHSRSPRLHAAAYRTLGLPWEYGRHEVDEGDLASFIATLDDQWRGLSLTMPLKPEALRLSASVSDVAEETGAVNTLLLGGDGPAGYNTDVYGIMRALRDAGVERVDRVLVLGAGATARSVVSAARRLGAASVVAAARRSDAADALADYAGALGLASEAADLHSTLDTGADLVVNTVPGGAAAEIRFGGSQTASTLFEVAYDPWPSPLVARWDGPAVSGLEMLLHQAVAQVRIFVTGDPHTPLEDENAILTAMRSGLSQA
ncbi:MAG TPA: shikimate dehydrogenase [Microbacteriaceae bacterium]|nr:shikimate dehydrogenase [Microbacteriaceae bacterium]